MWGRGLREQCHLLHSPPVFSHFPHYPQSRGFEALFPHAGTLGCAVCLAPQLFLPVYLHANVGPPSLKSTTSLGPPATALLRVLSIQVPISAPSINLDGCFFFNSLVVGLPNSCIFWQFWLFFVFKLIVLILLCEEAKCIYLHLHLGQKSSESASLDWIIFLVLESISCLQ